MSNNNSISEPLRCLVSVLLPQLCKSQVVINPVNNAPKLSRLQKISVTNLHILDPAKNVGWKRCRLHLTFHISSIVSFAAKKLKYHFELENNLYLWIYVPFKSLNSLNYCLLIWGKASPWIPNPLDSIQRRAIRLILTSAVLAKIQD